MIKVLEVVDWIGIQAPIIDVRSPAEFVQGHIPGATNLPLFTNAERAEIGTLYVQEGRDSALLEGLRLVGPRLHEMVVEAKRIAPDGRIRIHCWRGGERSGSVAWLFDKAGMAEVAVLKQGYKAFRNMVLRAFEAAIPLRVLGGFTGTGKTETLQLLAHAGAQTIDLEALAAHKGSAFGALGQPPQPTTEHFENLLWKTLRTLDYGRPIWVEDESAMIGHVNIPHTFFAQMRAATLYFANMPANERCERLVQDYGIYPVEQLAAAIQRIGRRMGPQHCKAALDALANNDLRQVARIALDYYDRSYLHGTSKRDPSRLVELSATMADLDGLAQKLNNIP